MMLYVYYVHSSLYRRCYRFSHWSFFNRCCRLWLLIVLRGIILVVVLLHGLLVLLNFGHESIWVNRNSLCHIVGLVNAN